MPASTRRILLRHPRRGDRRLAVADRRSRSRPWSAPSPPRRLFAFQTLVGLLLSNGPGTISAQGAKGAVSADGPETPERVQLNKALIGFLTHSGYAHGGNGYGIAFLIEQFQDADLPIRAIRITASTFGPRPPICGRVRDLRPTRRQPAAWTSGRSRA